MSIAQALTTSGGYVLIVLGRMRSLVLLTWTQVSLFVISAFLLLPQQEALLLSPHQEALLVAWLRLLVAAVGIWLSFWLLIRAFPILQWREILTPTSGHSPARLRWRRYYSLRHFRPASPLRCLKITLGAAIYVVSVLCTWWLAGRPDGAESYLWRKARTTLTRKQT